MPKGKINLSYDNRLVWVFKDSDITPIDHEGNEIVINPTELFDPVSNENDLIIGGKLFDIPNSFEVELISETLLSARKRVWVKKNEAEQYRGEVDIAKLTNTKEDRYGTILEGTLPDGTVLQHITQQNLYQRSKRSKDQNSSWVWVFANAIPYTGEVDTNALKNKKIGKRGKITGILETKEGSIELEYITESARRARLRRAGVTSSTTTISAEAEAATNQNLDKAKGWVWANAETAELYAGEVDVDKLKNKLTDKYGKITGTLETEEGPIILNYTTENARRQRAARRAKATNISTSNQLDDADSTTPPVSRRKKRQKINDQNEAAQPSIEEVQPMLDVTATQSISDETLSTSFPTESLTESEIHQLMQLDSLTKSLVGEDEHKRAESPTSLFFEGPQKRKKSISSDEADPLKSQKRR